MNVGAAFAAARLVITKTGDGEGRVVSAPEGIDCGEACEHVFDANATIILTASPGPHARISHWGDDCADVQIDVGSEASTESKCTIEMAQARYASVAFERLSYLLRVQRSGDGEGRVTGASTIDCGDACETLLPAETSITLNAEVENGSKFSGWSGACAGSQPTCVVQMDRARDVTASFDRNLVALTVSVLGDGDGHVASDDEVIACPPNCASSYPAGTVRTLTAEADPQTSIFEGWAGDCSGTAPCQVRLDEPTSVVATITRTRVALDIVGLGSGSVVLSPGNIRCTSSCAHTFPNDTLVTLTAEPTEPDRFAGWGSVCPGSMVKTCRVRVRGAINATASFRKPRVPIASNPEPTLVLGQLDFETDTTVTPTDNLWALRTPGHCTSDGTRLWIGDSGNARVLQWNAEPSVNRAAADLVLGQASASETSPGISLSRLNDRTGAVEAHNGALFVADMPSSRILRWNSIPSISGASADIVIGNDSTTSISRAVGQQYLDQPFSLTFAGPKMIVADTFNNRVLIFNRIPTETGFANADAVLGQRTFNEKLNYIPEPTSGTQPAGTASPPSGGTMNQPFDVHYDPVGDRLYVADTNNHRVLVWNGVPSSVSGLITSPDFIIGQVVDSSVSANQGRGHHNPTPTTLFAPRAVIAAYGSLFVSDGGNRRILVWTPPPDGPNDPADAVIGQTNLYAYSGVVPTRWSFDPRGLCALNDHLYVVSLSQNRVLRYDLSP